MASGIVAAMIRQSQDRKQLIRFSIGTHQTLPYYHEYGVVTRSVASVCLFVPLRALTFDSLNL